MTPPNLVIYGATGYSGRLIVERAIARGLLPLIAGRDEQSIASLASMYGLEWKTARVDEPARLRAVTASAGVLVNAAGPFAATCDQVIGACLETGTHYMDITGDSGTIEPAAAWHDRAVCGGVMVMPAAGFDVVASDCLLAHVARRLPGATWLRLGFDKSEPTSIGSLKTIMEMGGQGVRVRHGGKLLSVPPGSLTYDFDYGRGPQVSLAVNLGDTSSAFFSTGISNIETYMRASLPVWSATAANQYWGWLLGSPPWQAAMKTSDAVFRPRPHSRRAGRGLGHPGGGSAR